MNYYLVPGDSEEPVTQIAVSSDGTRCLVGSKPGVLSVYELEGSPPEPIESPGSWASIAGVSFIGSGNEALAVANREGGDSEVIRISESGATAVLLSEEAGRFNGLALGADGLGGWISGGDRILRFSIAEGACRPIQVPDGTGWDAVACSAMESETLAVGYRDNQGCIARLTSQEGGDGFTLLQVPVLPALRTAAMDHNSRRALAGGGAGVLALVEGENVRTMDLPVPCNVHGIAFHPSQGWALIATGPDGPSERGADLFRLDPESSTLESVYCAPPGAGALTCLAMLPDGEKALVGTEWGQLIEFSF